MNTACHGLLGGLLLTTAVMVAQAGRVAVEVTAPGEQFLAVNTSSAPITPRVIIRGWTDRGGFPPRHAAELTVNGIALLPVQMLTGATWILEPDGSAKWGYRTGTWSWAEGMLPDPRLQVFDPEKMNLDHWPPLQGPANIMMAIARGGTPCAWTCRIEFPAGAVVKKFCVSSNYEHCLAGKNATVVARVYADPDKKKLVTERTIDFATGLITFDNQSPLPNLFYLEITAKEIKTPQFITLYWVDFWAELDAAGLPRLTLQPGTNVLTVGDAEASSHQWRILLEDKALRDNPPALAPSPLPDYVKNHKSRFRDQPAPALPLVTPATLFPLGFYDGLSLNSLDFVVEDMMAMNCNAVYGSNMNAEPQYLGPTLDRLERAGLYLIYQGGGSGALYYQQKGYFNNDVEQEIEFNELNFKPSAKKLVPTYRSRPGLVAWSLAEEVTPDVPERMVPYYALMRELDPTHPPVFLHNNYEAAKNDLEKNHPAAITHDRYPFSYDPRSAGPTNLAASLNAVLGVVKMYRQLCDSHQVPFWFMGQAFGDPTNEDYVNPPYGRCYGQRFLSPAILRMQGWAALAEGARGLFWFLYGPCDGSARDRYWRKTPVWDGVQTLFGEVKPLTPLLLRLQRDDDRDGEVQAKDPTAPLVLRVFTRRDQPELTAKGLYVIALNRSDTVATALVMDGTAVQKAGTVWDLKRGKALAPTAVLEPGEGTLLWLGNAEQIAADQALPR